MVTISDLEVEISKYILDEGLVHYSDLETEFSISKPTISKYLSDIALYVTKLGGDLSLIRDRQKGIYFAGKVELLRSDISKQTVWHPVTPKDRRMYILAALLFERKMVTISELTKSLFVSQRTLESDLAWIRAYIHDNNGILINDSGILKLKMSKNYLYAFMIHTFHDYWGESINQSDDKKVILPPILQNFFDENTARRIFRFVDVFLKNYHFTTTEYEYTSLVIYLLIQYTLFGNSSFFVREKDEDYIEPTMEKETYTLLEWFEKDFGYDFSMDQQRFLNNFVVLIKSENNQPLLFDKNNEIERIKKIIVGNEETINFYDNKFLDGLSKHISMCIKRIRFGMKISNPYTEDFKKTYPIAFEEALELSEKLSKSFDITFNDDEIAFIGMYFESLSERKGIIVNKTSAVIVCNTGIGTSRFLEEKIKQTMGNLIDVKGVSITHELPKLKIQADIIISTVPLTKTDRPSVLVSPFLTDSDRKHIIGLINEVKQTTLSKEVFKKLLNPELIVIEDKRLDYKKALKHFTDQTTAHEFSNKGIYKAAIDREKLSSTAMDKIALPHSATDYITKPFIGIIVSKKGIDWLGTTVHIAFFMGLKDIDSSTMKTIYHELNKLVENNRMISKLIDSKDSQQIINILEEENFE